jgi:hypothetical protein
MSLTSSVSYAGVRSAVGPDGFVKPVAPVSSVSNTSVKAVGVPTLARPVPPSVRPQPSYRRSVAPQASMSMLRHPSFPFPGSVHATIYDNPLYRQLSVTGQLNLRRYPLQTKTTVNTIRAIQRARSGYKFTDPSIAY